MTRMLQVLLTVDVETYPIHKDWKTDGLARDLRRDVYGELEGRAVGLGYQLQTFARHGLAANLMVESLFSAVPEVGLAPLQGIVRAIQQGGHEVHLHPHTEWIPYIPRIGVPYRGHLLRSYPLDEQETILRFGLRQLELAGASAPVAFRAGGFAANRDTLTAVERCGIPYDLSFNACYGDGSRHLPAPLSFGQATAFSNVLELPVAVFEDHPFHLRPAQLCACSYEEMTYALDRAERQGWQIFVIVSHSFEMLFRRWHPTRPPVIRQVVVERFEQLCAFLGQNRHRFQTSRIADLRLSPAIAPVTAIKGRLANTGARMLNQASTRFGQR